MRARIIPGSQGLFRPLHRLRFRAPAGGAGAWWWAGAAAAVLALLGAPWPAVAATAVVTGVGVVFLATRHGKRVAVEAAPDPRVELGAIIDAAFDAVITMDAAGLVLHWNRQAVHMFGWTEQEALRRPLADLIIPDAQRQAHREGLRRYVRTRESEMVGRRVEVEAMDKHGATFPVELSVTAIGNGAVAFVGYVRAIADRVAAERALRDSEARYRTLFENAVDGIFITDASGGLEDVNPSGCAALGYTRDEAQRLAISDMLPAGDLGAATAEWTGLRSGARVVSHRQLLRKDGARVDVEISARRLSDGRLIGIVRDLTERKRAEARVRAVEHRYQELVNHAPYGIYRSTIGGRFQTVNPALIHMLGFESAEAMLQVDIAQAVYADPEEREALMRRLDHVDEIHGVEAHWRRQDGREITVRLEGRVLRGSDGGVTGYEMFVRDVTERYQLERQLRRAQRLQALGTLASGISHDFNNILLAIVGYAELTLTRQGDGTYVARNAEFILAAARRAERLVRQILAFTRQGASTHRPVDVASVTVEALAFLRASLPPRIEIAADLPNVGSVRADPDQIHQVIMNLATNAAHAMEERGGTLAISLSQETLDTRAGVRLQIPRGDYVRITVADTGTGMAAGIVDQIFDPFFTTKDVGKGTGLGLSLVHGIVRNHAGAVQVESTVGIGTVFDVYLPSCEPDRSDGGPDDPAAVRGIERVLFLDDDPQLAKLGKERLEPLGYEVVALTDAREALARFAADRFDVVVTDFNMPDLSGTDVFEQVRVLRPDVPVVVTSGLGDGLDHLDGTLEGCVVLAKPYGSAELARTLRAILDQTVRGG